MEKSDKALRIDAGSTRGMPLLLLLIVGFVLLSGLLVTSKLLVRSRQGVRIDPLPTKIQSHSDSSSFPSPRGDFMPTATRSDSSTLIQSFRVPLEGTPTLQVETEKRRYVSRLTLRNSGQSVLKDLRISEKHRDWSSAESILRTILEIRNPKDDRQKALCIFDYVHDHLEREAYRSQWDSFDVWKAFNVYGMGHCEVHSRTIAALWEMAGLASVQANVGFNPGLDLLNHTMAEVFYDRGWHLFDSHGSNFFLSKDNRSILGWRDLWGNPELIQRSGPVGELYAPYDHTRWMDPDTYTWTFDHKVARTQPWKGEIPPQLNLRPGESVTYEREGGSTYINNINDHGPPNVPHSRALFTMVFPPANGDDLDVPIIEGFEAVESNHLRLEPNLTGRVRFEVRTPYPIVSATLEAALDIEGAGNLALLKVQPLGHPEMEAEWLRTFPENEGEIAKFPLEASFEEWNDPFARYGFAVILEATSQSEGSIDLISLRVETACQFATGALPRLEHGPWILSSTPDSMGFLEVDIESLPYPDAIVVPTGVAASKVSSGTESWIEFAWATPTPTSDSNLDFEVDLSDDPDFRWSLLPYLTYFTDPAQESLRIPFGLFPENAKFYFRVRTKNHQGLCSEWSDTLEFSTAEAL